MSLGAEFLYSKRVSTAQLENVEVFLVAGITIFLFHKLFLIK
ncbi:hypothetical protein J945_2768 [Acinetobacter baumannii 25878_2]|nr:hypothetical protein J946_3524 [Acinetobacter baumannii 25878_3]EYD26755.1 hypothetical protein J944_3386 [Acinetobacter baumannii 25878_1]EYD37689.1 hypothetical protein J945_2768 [Acinetobacter baumannii 25878_2]EYR93664.1 hypothetical protein J974_3073 [Acinetobacter baumannii 26016_8]EYS01463.1 hypothetical protein J971_3371 [Acinetobacter baumannii 26016_5]EYS07196.1 hypothetical protein J976_3668 [Acinetobacter baumannii 26016_10]EYS21775.1 hypothetical protein J972_3419 [Acinetobact